MQHYCVLHAGPQALTSQHPPTAPVHNISFQLSATLQGLYVWDALYHEPAILTTMDIVSDGFGFMLAFGDTSLVPFTYSLQARLLVSRGPTLGALSIAGLIALKGLGYATFRGSNSQKDQFRRDPGHASVAHLSSLPTERGTRLLTSGWWGLSRHPNYLGDWLMAWAWCLPTGRAAGLVPYYYVIYFAALLGEGRELWRGDGWGSESSVRGKRVQGECTLSLW